MNKKEIIVVTNPMIAANRSAEVTLSKFLRVIKPSVESIQVIGGNLSVENDLNDIQLISFPITRHPNDGVCYPNWSKRPASLLLDRG